MRTEILIVKEDIFLALRFIFAIILIFWAAIPLVSKGKELVSRNLKEFISSDTTTTQRDEESPALWVWAYGLQLLAWAAMLGVSLWAIVALCSVN